MKTEPKWPADAGTYQVETDPVGEVAWVPEDDDGDEHSCAIVEVVGRTTVAVVATFPRDLRIDHDQRRTAEAIAQLYCSAPRLYAALEALLKSMPTDTYLRSKAQINEAIEALYAARGEAPETPNEPKL